MQILSRMPVLDCMQSNLEVSMLHVKHWHIARTGGHFVAAEDTCSLKSEQACQSGGRVPVF